MEAKAATLVLLLLCMSKKLNAFNAPNPESVLIITSHGQDGKAVHSLSSQLPHHLQQLSGRKLLQQQTVGEPEPIMRWLVDKHNELRSRHNVPSLTWDWTLAWNAYNYVMNCPNGHSGAQGIGENLAWGHHDFNHAMRDWYDEIQFYNFNQPGFAENTGHFTMLVWRSAAKIGCAANLRCRFKTWICQFTPAGNFVNYDGSVDYALWTSEVLAPGQQWVTGTKPDGTPSYASYDPTGESTRGLPAPQYGELKNFGFVPKPGHSVVMYDWQKYIPTVVLQTFLPVAVLKEYLDKDVFAMLEPVTKGAVHEAKLLVGWQMAIPARVVKQYVPADVLQKYVPDGVVMATEVPDMGQRKPGNKSQSSAPTATAVPAVVAAALPKQGLAGLLSDIGSIAGGSDAAGAQPATYVPVVTAAPAYPPVQQAGYMPGGQPQAYYVANPTGGYAQQYAAASGPAAAAPGYAVPVQPFRGQGYVYPATQATRYVATSGYVQQQPGTQAYSSNMAAAAAAGYAPAVTAMPSRQGSVMSTYRVPDGSNNQPMVIAGQTYTTSGQTGQTNANNVMMTGLSRDVQGALDRHNLYRSRHQASPLMWDDQLAAQAAEFVRSCPMGVSGKPGVGENAAWGYPDAALAVDAWYGQISQYNFASPGYTPSASHFTQLVWAGTEKIGCAVAAGCPMPTLVCQYYPAGNVLGQDWSQQVHPPTAAVPKAIGMQPVVGAAVNKPPLPVGIPSAAWERLGEPVSNDGSPIAMAAPNRPAAAALLSDELQAALDRHNKYR